MTITKEEYMHAQDVIAQWEREQIDAVVIPGLVLAFMQGYTEEGTVLPGGSRVALVKAIRDYLAEYTDWEMPSLKVCKWYVWKFCNEHHLGQI